MSQDRPSAPALSGSSVVVVTPGQASCDLGGEAVILHFESALYYGLNEVGARLWSLLREPTTVDDLCAALLAEYDVSEDQCRTDVMAILEELLRAELIEVRGVEGS